MTRWLTDERVAELQAAARKRGAAKSPAIASKAPTPPAKRASVAGVVQQPLIGLCRAAGLPEPVAEFRFSPPRRWRFDYAWPMQRIAVEIDGGAWTQGRHTRGAGFIADMEKQNAAALAGWRILRYTPEQLCNAIPDLATIL